MAMAQVVIGNHRHPIKDVSLTEHALLSNVSHREFDPIEDDESHLNDYVLCTKCNKLFKKKQMKAHVNAHAAAETENTTTVDCVQNKLKLVFCDAMFAIPCVLKNMNHR